MGTHWTCCSCEQQVEDHQYEADERMCFDCLNSIDNYIEYVNKEDGGIVSRMPWIAKLADDGNLKELTEELGSSQMAEGFIEAAKTIRDNKDKPEYKKLNEIHDEMDKYRKQK